MVGLAWLAVALADAGVYARDVGSPASDERIRISRVALMPELPEPFKVRDWKTTATGAYRLLFDDRAAGQHLPLIWWDDSKINRPQRGFGLPSYVGRPGQEAGVDGGANHEAITTIGAVYGATLAGLDMSALGTGRVDFVSMLANYHNTANGEAVVLNHTRTESGQSYWYELFPLMMLTAVADQYPANEPVQTAVQESMDRWASAVASLMKRTEGLNFEHTSFNLRTMKAVENGKWREPDAAAALAWLQYVAFTKYGGPERLDLADACLTWLERRKENPNYEVMLPFGVYAAARMNAEQGKSHDVGRLVNWCFEPSVTRSGWGVIVDRWGGQDVSGLMGSTTDGGGYGFYMNTLVYAAALVPAVRYDERLAPDVGKWMLNLVNAARLFYPDELPPEQQTSPGWQSEPMNVIAYEGLRKRKNGKALVATGDPTTHGWGPSDLGLYGSGYVGVLAAMVGRTDDPRILKLDLLATDVATPKAYPTYLMYNPYEQERRVRFQVGAKAVDLYDAVSSSFVSRGATGEAELPIAARSAMVLVEVPAGANIEDVGGKRFAGGVVIDYHNGLTQRPEPATRPTATDLARPFNAPRATINVDGNASDWSKLGAAVVALNTGGRGTLRATLQCAWDDDYLYVLVKQVAKGQKHEAADAADLHKAPWDFDAVWLFLQPGNGELPVVNDVIVTMGFSSLSAHDLFVSDQLEGTGVVQTATSGNADDGSRVIEGRIAWEAINGAAFNGINDLMQQVGRPAVGMRVGLEPMLVEYNHTRQSFVGGAQYRRPSGRDANSRDLVLGK
jgi:hypothetical protein